MSSVSGNAVSEAVVWLDAPGLKCTRPELVVLDQHDLNFLPRVLAVQMGTRGQFPNNDRVQWP
jgi:hypothetical protein